MGKTNPLNDEDLKDFIQNQKSFTSGDNSWMVNINDIDPGTIDLSVKNPNKKDEVQLRSPEEILEEMKALDKESAEILNSIMELI